jgi:hypothetical protein
LDVYLATSDNRLAQGYTGPNATIAVPSVVDQVAQYLVAQSGKFNVEDVLYVILVGANDAFFGANVTGVQSVRKIASIMEKLGKKGSYPAPSKRLI